MRAPSARWTEPPRLVMGYFSHGHSMAALAKCALPSICTTGSSCQAKELEMHEAPFRMTILPLSPIMASCLSVPTSLIAYSISFWPAATNLQYLCKLHAMDAA